MRITLNKEPLPLPILVPIIVSLIQFECVIEHV